MEKTALAPAAQPDHWPPAPNPESKQRSFGRHWSYNLRNDPKRLPFVLARYKFAASLATRDRRVLELGCSEGIGYPFLARDAASYTGVDFDAPAIETARDNWASERCSFVQADFLGQNFGRFDTVVSLDVIEHIHVDYEDLFFQTVARNLDEDGVCVIGTPNVTAAAYASEASQRGHINLYDADRLAAAMHKVFHYAPMCHYLIQVGCYKRTAGGER
jgi:2-polyprenyl-3-methyl-5-hydroxy-6-metoxy-1,4-benzoquinol methylase